MSFELSMIFKTTGILACAGLLSLVLRRASASARHAMWAIGLWSILALPPAATTLPKLAVPVRVENPILNLDSAASAVTSQILEPLLPMAASSHVVTTEESPVGPPVAPFPALPPWTWTQALPLVWGLGAFVVLVRGVLGFWKVRRLRMISRPASERDWSYLLNQLQGQLSVAQPVELRIGGKGLPPMTWGVFRHVILLPETATRWAEDRLRIVLAHEMAHVKRNDGLTQIFVQIACSIYWFNPVVWYAAYRLRLEREQACDDQVLRLGIKADDYAEHLLDIARSIRSNLSFATVSMAHPSQLETRLRAILNPHTRRERLSKLATASLLSSVAVFTLSVAVIQLTTIAPLALPILANPVEALLSTGPTEPVQVTASSIEGLVLGAMTGQPIGGAVISISQSGSQPLSAISEADGRFIFKGLVAGTHRMTTKSVGHAPARAQGQTAIGDSGVLVTVGGGESLSGVVLRLYPASVITGRVVDSRGRPVVGVQAMAGRYVYDESGNRKFRMVGLGSDPIGTSLGRTNDRGEFRLFDLEAGEYYVRIDPAFQPLRPGATPDEEVLETTYYPGFADPSDATVVPVGWGDEVRLKDIPIRFVKPVPIRLDLVNETGLPEGFVRGYSIYRKGELITSFLSGSNLSGGPGRFQISGLAPGTYELLVGWYDVGDGGGMQSGRTTIEARGAEVTGSLVIRKSPAMSGRVVFEETDGTVRALPGISMKLEADTVQLSAKTDLEGRFTIPSVPETEYKTRFSGAPTGASLLLIRQNDAVVPADRVRIAGESTLEIVFGSGGGAVTGSVMDSSGARIAGAAVVLVPAAPLRAHGQLYRVATSDQKGNFLIPVAPPGPYRIFAWSDIDGAAYRNAEFLKRFEEQGSDVRISRDQSVVVEIRIADEKPK